MRLFRTDANVRAGPSALRCAAGTAVADRLTGKSTVMRRSDYRFGADLTERDFTKTGLKRVR